MRNIKVKNKLKLAVMMVFVAIVGLLIFVVLVGCAQNCDFDVVYYSEMESRLPIATAVPTPTLYGIDETTLDAEAHELLLAAGIEVVVEVEPSNININDILYFTGANQENFKTQFVETKTLNVTIRNESDIEYWDMGGYSIYRLDGDYWIRISGVMGIQMYTIKIEPSGVHVMYGVSLMPNWRPLQYEQVPNYIVGKYKVKLLWGNYGIFTISEEPTS